MSIKEIDRFEPIGLVDEGAASLYQADPDLVGAMIKVPEGRYVRFVDACVELAQCRARLDERKNDYALLTRNLNVLSERLEDTEARLAEMTDMMQKAVGLHLDCIKERDEYKARLAEAEKSAQGYYNEAAKALERAEATDRRLAEAERNEAGHLNVIRGLQARLAKAEEWRDYYRAKWLGDKTLPMPAQR